MEAYNLLAAIYTHGRYNPGDIDSEQHDSSADGAVQ
jgi:hypothetical protein